MHTDVVQGEGVDPLRPRHARAEAGIAARGRIWDALAVALLAVLPLLFLKELPGGLPPYGGDVLVHVYPLLSLLAHGLRAGRPVLWNFYAAGGYPLAPYGALTLYPPVTVALLALPVTSAIAALYAFYIAVLGIGMYALAGDLSLSRPARLLAAVTLAYGGFVAAHVYAGHLFELGAIAPLPLAYLLLRRAIRGDRWQSAVWCGAVIGLMVLAAGVQFLPFALAPLPVLALWHMLKRLRERDAATRRIALWRLLWPLIALVLAGVVAVALSAVFVLPFREILPATLRAGSVQYSVATAQSLPWGGLIMLVAPDAFGNAAAGTYWPASRFGPYFHEIYAYAGLLPLLLAPVALLRRRESRPYGALALLAVLVMLGSHTPFYGLLYALPGGELLRAPARAGIVLDFALALLAGFGLDALRGSVSAVPAQRRLAIVRHPLLSLAPGSALALAVIAGLLVAVTVGGAIPVAGRDLAVTSAARLAALLAVSLPACAIVALVPTGRTRYAREVVSLILPALALLDLFTANGALLHPLDPAGYFSPAPALSALPPGAAPYRVLALDGAVPAGLGMVTRRLYDVQDTAPLALADYWRLSHPSLVQRAQGGVVVTGRDVIRDVDPFFLRIFGVRTIFSATPVPDPALRFAGRVTSVRWDIPGGASWNVQRRSATSLVYRDDAALPRFFVVAHAVHVPDAAAALGLLRNGVDPAHVAVLSPAPPSPAGLLASLQRAWAAWLGADRDNGMSLPVSSAGPAYLVVDDGWFPGWTSTLDGRATPVLRADYVLRAVRVPAGRHEVRLVYAPLSYLLGALVTLATALALLILATIGAVRRLRRPRITGAAVD